MRAITQAEFFGTPLNIIDHAGKHWLTAEEVGLALGYDPANARHGIIRLYKRNADEFTEADTGVVKLTTPGGPQDTRIFSDTGCHKLGFFASTPRAKDFRTWASKVLAAQPEATALPPLSTRTGKGRVAITREIEQQVLQAFADGHARKDIARALGISAATVSLLLHAKYRFAPHLGESLCSDVLIDAVVERHRQNELERLRAEQQRIANLYCSRSSNQRLTRALDAVGADLLPLHGHISGKVLA